MTSPITGPWLAPADLDTMLDPDLRDSIATDDRAWWIQRAQDRITDSPRTQIPTDPTPEQSAALGRAVVAWIEAALDPTASGSGGRIRIGHVEIDSPEIAGPVDGAALPGTVTSILASAGMMSAAARAQAW